MQRYSWMILVFLSISLAGQSKVESATDSYFLVFLHTNPERGMIPEDQVQRLQEGHMANISRLAAKGVLLVAGPFDSGGGLFIFVADSVSDIAAHLQTDPAIRSGRFNVEIFQLSVEYGKICRAPEDYNMVTYQCAWHTKPPHQKAKNSTGITRFYTSRVSKDDSLIFAAKLAGDSDGMIYLLDYESRDKASQVLRSFTDIGVINEELHWKQLWVAQESFCRE